MRRPKSAYVKAKPKTRGRIKTRNQSNYVKKNKRDGQIYLNGLSIKQWKCITNFTIAGQSNKKKKNFNVAIDHYFNLKSMFRKIN